ncbi:dTDP-4-dehydrorhamnose 3,5-epimerase-like enzyme [Nocardioides zeae]|uniref:dTDP-4-dehydrorhamnose 3,5-epimerase-like enzyme n=1 Tax=Nocardioides zeae TaxID=1457234 RepID=A0ACC6IHL8_9ACTN|nr:dTDP-4-dehydrorhamnose 3,5-epimerase family protein [Nocardioides zeae]MDR6176097.1 dTDP-4-dehydrorhamnose 3,5-epimerase-like enzyme [Nocardioides zeae]MDR6210243.1 dTDP-4-dehydrorhamnose 3,5-epimerase-like enzyme [Nocardioides zeae]
MTAREALPGLWELPLEATSDTTALIPADLEAAVGHSLDVGHIHHVQGMLGVVHGLRFSPLPGPADWAYLTCSRGEVLALVVDVRVGSPSFGRHREVRLSAAPGEPGTATPDTTEPAPLAGLYVGPGLAHGFTALDDDSVLTHLGPRGRRPEKDRLVHAFDPTLRLPWPIDTGATGATGGRSALTLPPEGADAPLLAALQKSSRLPTWADWRAHITERG